MKNRFFLYILVFSSAAYFLLSCSTSAVRDSEKVAKVDKKIISEFHENTENADFYAACGSYIEFLNCCDDERKTKLTYELKQLYETKMEEALDAGDTLTAIEYTYSLINIFKGNIPDTEWNTYYDTLKQYIERYVSSELSNKGKLEKASWLIYLTQFTAGNQFLYRELIEIFLERRNLLLVNKYFETYSALMNTEEESGHAEEVASLQARIEELESDI